VLYEQHGGCLTRSRKQQPRFSTGNLMVAHLYSFLYCVFIILFCFFPSCALCTQCCQSLDALFGVHYTFKSHRGKNTNLTAQRSNSNSVWFNLQKYILFSINLVSQVTLRSSGTDILYGCHLLRCLYNILYFM
jgi:hypothetical protein